MLSAIAPSGPGHAAAPAIGASAPHPASADAVRLLAWIMAANDAHGLPFIVIDKVNARATAFDGQGVLQGTSTILLGAAKGDVSPPGIGTMRLADIGPALRVTPAGRFEARLGRDLGPGEVLWVDYEAAIALHRVATGTPAEHRLQRLASTVPADKRISYGCINVPVLFFESVVLPLFQPADGIVYILPETGALTLPLVAAGAGS